MKITITQLIKLAIALIALPLFAVILLNNAYARTETSTQAADPATAYAAKCKMCHGVTAEKKFDATLPDDQLVEAVMKGKKVEKPPNMPGFEAKGMTTDEAKALVAYMKSLKK